MSEHEGCYVFTGENVDSGGLVVPKSKRMKNAKSGNLRQWPDESFFVPLLTGLENAKSVHTRSDLFHAAWGPRQASIEKLQRDINNDTVRAVANFIVDPDLYSSTGKITAGLILVKPGTETYSGLIDSIAKHLQNEEKAIVINLTSSQAPNLKSVLKYINQNATNQHTAMGDEDIVADRQKGGRQLNYDLQILCDYVNLHSITRVVLSFQDGEAFDGGLLGDVIDVLSSWNDRIPFLFLIGIATSIDLFQEKLPKAAIRTLQGARFDMERLPVDDILKATVSLNGSRFVWLGPGLSSTMIQQHNDYVQSTSSFIEAIKYAYMAHFFANPLSILIDNRLSPTTIQPEHFESIRNLPSFQRFSETRIEQGDYEAVHGLLNDDAYLYDSVVSHVEQSQKALHGILVAIDVMLTLQSCSLSATRTPWSELYVKGMSGGLVASALAQDTLLSCRKMSSDTMSNLLSKLSTLDIPGITEIEEDLKGLTSTMNDGPTPLRSEHDVQHDSLRTTIVAQKVSLSKRFSTLSKQDLAYSKIVSRVDNLLRDFLQASLIDPKELFLHEVLIYDSKSPHRDVLTPKPRFAIERALSSPHDYLGCSCCEGVENGLSATQPATAILYQLYLESGAVINTSDLWSAFYAVVGVDDAEDEDANQHRALALFSRALAELKYLGMVKNSRKNADHLVKLSWKGL